MLRFLMRPSFGCLMLATAVLLVGCSDAENKPAPALSTAQATALRKEVADLQTELARIDGRLAELRRQQAQAMAELTTATQNALILAQSVHRQLGGQPGLPRPALRPGPGEKPAEDRGPLTPLLNFFLIVVSLFAIYVIARIFLGRHEEDEDDEDLGPDAADEELSNDEGTIRVGPEAQPAAPASAPDLSPPEHPEPTDVRPDNEGSEPKP